MKETHSRRWQRIAHRGALLAGSAVLVIGIGAIGVSSSLSRTSAASRVNVPVAHRVSVPASTTAAVRPRLRVVRVSIVNFSFQSARLVVSAGTRVIWTNNDGTAHTVTSDKGIWSSSDLNPGTQFARVFAKVGTFPYHCSIHPFMHGTIVVKK